MRRTFFDKSKTRSEELEALNLRGAQQLSRKYQRNRQQRENGGLISIIAATARNLLVFSSRVDT